MKQNKTQQTEQSVADFLNQIPDESVQESCKVIAQCMQGIAKAEPKMWGTTVVGFGLYHYTYATGREGDWFQFGFSPRKNNLTLYISKGFEHQTEVLDRLGKHSIGKSCLYIKNIADIDIEVLKELLLASV